MPRPFAEKITVDFLSKKMKINEGEILPYYVSNSHLAIIDPEEWNMVQTKFTKRKQHRGRYSGNCILASHLVCSDCDAFFGSKVWHSTGKYCKVIWLCNNKLKENDKC